MERGDYVARRRERNAANVDVGKDEDRGQSA